MGKTERLNEAVVAAMALGTGVGVHLSERYGPWVASAGVVATAWITRRQYRSAFAQLEADIQDAHDKINDLITQVQDVRDASETRLSTLAMISHEIRSPLSAVIALGDLLQRMPLTGEQLELVGDIRDASEMVLGVVNDTLDLAKLEKGRLQLAQHPFSLLEMLNRVVRHARALAINKPGVVVLAPTCPVDQVIGDEFRIQQVLLNLVSNAVRFTPSGTVNLSVQAEPLAGEDGWLLIFQVDDQGPGLPLHEHQHLFLPYAQARSRERTNTTGTGLGLYLSRLLVEQMGGEIGVRNRLEGGARFWFSLKLQGPSPSTGAAHAVPGTERSSQALLSGKTIWVVDDARLNREVARRVVETHGGECRLFDSARGFLQHAWMADQPADVVLMDIEMPELDGLSAARALRDIPRWSGVPVIAVTGQASDRVAHAVKDHELADFVLKPFHAQTLLEAIQTQLTPPEF